MSTKIQKAIDKLAIHEYNQTISWRYAYEEVEKCTQTY